MKIDFEFQTAYGLFRDALHLPDDNTLTDSEIEALKQERVDNWIVLVTTPPADTPGNILADFYGDALVDVPLVEGT